MSLGLLFLIVLLTISGLIITLYNSLIHNKNQVDKAFASTDILLKKRYDLIPNLVAVVQNYAKFEQSTLTEVTRLRARAMSSRLPTESRIDFENEISRTLGNVFVAVEAYPELKANVNFIELQESLNEIEEQLSAARRFYNTSVTDYNNALEMFPTNFLASAMNYQAKVLFKTSQQERQNVDVRNLFNQ